MINPDSGSSVVFVGEMLAAVGEIFNVGEIVVFALASSISVGVGVNNTDVVVVGVRDVLIGVIDNFGEIIGDNVGLAAFVFVENVLL